MLQHCFILIYRNFRRFKTTFFINLIGLSTGLACALLIYLWVNDELGIDKFHHNESHLYQVMQNYPLADNIITIESTPSPLAKALEDEIPEVKDVAVSTGGWHGPQGVIAAGNAKSKATELYVSPNFFEVFSYPLVNGDPSKVLGDKYNVLLSDELSMKLFHTTEGVVGKTIQWERGMISGSTSSPLTVAGIFSKIQENSTAQFDLVLNYAVYYDNVKTQLNLDRWDNSNPSTFVVLNDGVDIDAFNDKLRDFCTAKFEIKKEDAATLPPRLFLQKYSDRYLFNQYENGRQTGGRIAYVKLFSIIAVFILIIACINFMNLSTAKASRRIKEIGIKKAIGAHRKSLIFQYMLESLFMAFVSLVLAILAVDILLPQFNLITGKQIALEFDSGLVTSVLLITLITGIVAGSYPALYLSGFHPAKVLKGKLETSLGESWTRKGLVVAQFTISVVLIVSVLVVYKQISFIQTKNLGYSRENVIQFAAEGKIMGSFEVFRAEAVRIPGITNITTAANNVVQNNNATGGVSWEGKKPGEKVEFGNLGIGDDFFETMNMTLTDGRNFIEGSASESSKIIFNETAIAVMGLKDPIGKTVNIWGEDRQIIGIVHDFNFESLYKKIKPCFVLYSPSNIQNILVKIAPGKESTVIAQIEKLYREFNPGLAFEYTFVDSEYEKLYASENRVGELSRYFAGMAIILSCLGLFGLASFTAERRIKEIGIRKVMGATEFGIVTLLSGGFTKIVFIAIIIALPASYLVAQFWLDNFAYKIALEWWYFAGAGIAAMLISWITVGSQAYKAARVNPSKCLKDE